MPLRIFSGAKPKNKVKTKTFEDEEVRIFIAREKERVARIGWKATRGASAEGSHLRAGEKPLHGFPFPGGRDSRYRVKERCFGI
jgi:hypothetical protein